MSFYLGVISGLGERARNEKRKDETESNKYALVVQEKSTRVRVWIKEAHPNTRTVNSNSRNVNRDAYEAGKNHSKYMSFNNRQSVQGALSLTHSN